jgi:hypothetical protein
MYYTLFQISIIVTIVTTTSVINAYRPSTYTNAPTSLSYGSGMTSTITTKSDSDAAVATYLRKRYNTDDGTSMLKTIYAPTTADMNVVSTTSATNAMLQRTKWGVDNQYPNEYWFDERIHSLGNHGFWGAVHAALAPISTKMIDIAAYDGIDVRKMVSTVCKWSSSRFSQKSNYSSLFHLVANRFSLTLYN